MSEELYKRIKTGPLNKIFAAIDCDDVNIKKLTEAIESEPDTINDVDCDGHTVLHRAIQKGADDAAIILLNCKNLDINIQSNETSGGYTPLMLAIFNWNNEIIEKILNEMQDLDLTLVNACGRTALMIAYYHGYDDIVTVFLKDGASDYSNWKKWDTGIDFNIETHDVMVNCRSYGPDWNVDIHWWFPSEFREIVMCVLCVFNRFKKIRIYKDLRLMLIRQIAKNWKLTRD